MVYIVDRQPLNQSSVMETIELRLNRKRVIPMIVLIAVGIGFGTWYACFSGKVPRNTLEVVIYAVTVITFIYAAYFKVKKLWNNEPVLILTSAGISIHEKGEPLSFLWWQVVHWEIEKDDSTHYLVIQTADTKKRINISWLDRKPAEIERLMHQYKRV